jgi:hypothetical protein
VLDLRESAGFREVEVLNLRESAEFWRKVLILKESAGFREGEHLE